MSSPDSSHVVFNDPGFIAIICVFIIVSVTMTIGCVVMSCMCKKNGGVLPGVGPKQESHTSCDELSHASDGSL